MKQAHLVRPPRPARRPRGVGLLDAMIALAILAFGLLGMTRLQTNLVRQSTDSQSRLTAVQLGDELLSTALVDAGNAACYTVPATGVCGSATAASAAALWYADVQQSLPGYSSATSVLNGDQLTVTIQWTDRTDGSETRTLQVTTDVRDN
jgi:type IV pilus assembly protein PilV